MTKTGFWVTGLAICALSSLSGCATVSESECLAGDWETMGYEASSAGGPRDNFGTIVKDCQKHSVTPDRVSYMAGYDQGLKAYCVFDRGFDRAAAGGTPLSECARGGYVDYAEGVEEGRVAYQLRRQHSSLVEDYRDTAEQIEVLENQIINDSDLTDTDITAMRRDIRRLDGTLVDLRIDIRAFESEHDWPSADLD